MKTVLCSCLNSWHRCVQKYKGIIHGAFLLAAAVAASVLRREGVDYCAPAAAARMDLDL